MGGHVGRGRRRCQGNRPIWQSFEFEDADLPLHAMSFIATPFTAKTLDTLITPPDAGRLSDSSMPVRAVAW
jgi:hypothetical protein